MDTTVKNRTHAANLIVFLSFGGLAWQPASVAVANWTIEPVLRLGATYSDNITAAPPDREEDDVVTEIIPGVLLNSRNRRFSADVDYRMQNLVYVQDDDRNKTYHQLRALGTGEFVEEHLFMDAIANIDQETVSLDRPFTFDNLTPGNRTNVYTAALSPYYRLAIGEAAEAELRYTGSIVRYSEGASDGESNAVNMGVGSNREVARLQWNLRYDELHVNRETAEDQQYRSGQATMGYQVTPVWQAIVDAGYENNDLETTIMEENGFYWAGGVGWKPNRYIASRALYGPRYSTAGITWTPTALTTMNLQWRDREVGLNPGGVWSAELSVRARRFEWRANYLEDTTTTQQLHISRSFPSSKMNDFDQTGLEPVAPIFSLTDDVFERKYASTSVIVRTVKTSLLLSIFSERRDSLSGLDDDDVTGSSGAWEWRFAEHASLNVRGAIQATEQQGNDQDDTIWMLSAGVTRNISRMSKAGLQYGRQVRSADNPELDYRENRVGAFVEFRF